VSLLSTIAGAASGFLTGGPLGAVIGGIAGYQGGGAPASPGTAVAIRAPQLPAVGAGGGYNVSIGGPGGIQLGGNLNFGLGGQAVAPGAAGACPRGYHLNKHALGATKKHGAVPARSMCVRNRSMNPLNPKALRKALSREKRARKLISRLHVFKPVRHAAAPRRKR